VRFSTKMQDSRAAHLWSTVSCHESCALSQLSREKNGTARVDNCAAQSRAANHIRHVPAERPRVLAGQMVLVSWLPCNELYMSHMVGHGEVMLCPVPMHALIVSRKHLPAPSCSCSLWLLYGATSSIVPIVSTCYGGLTEACTRFSHSLRTVLLCAAHDATRSVWQLNA
jgi:hypothetical protein